MCPCKATALAYALLVIRNQARANMRRFVIPFNRYSRLERWLSARLDRQINSAGEVRWTFNHLSVVGALLMASVPQQLSAVAPYSDFT